MQKTTLLKVFICLISIILSPLAALAQNDCSTLNISVVATNATCESNGTIIVTVEPNPNVDMTQLEYGLSTMDGTSVSPTPNGGVFQNVSPGTYVAYVRAFCFEDGNWRNIQANTSVTIISTYLTPNMAIANANVRKTLNCVNSGMIPISFTYGLAPYTATMLTYPEEYEGETDFIKTASGILQIDDLPEGTYSFRLMDACSKWVEATTTVDKVSSDVPTSAMGLYTGTSYRYPTAIDPPCKGIDVVLSQLSSSHELYPYFTSLAVANRYYEMVLTETATGKTSAAEITTASTSYIRAISGLALIDYTYEDMYPAAGSYPAGIASTAGAVTAGVRVKNCLTVGGNTNLTIYRPDAYVHAPVGRETKNYTCTGSDLYTSYSIRPTTTTTLHDRYKFVCYPLTVTLFNESGGVVAINTIESAETSTVFTNTPYGTYKIEYTGANGAKWGTDNFISRKPVYIGSYYNLDYCPDDGKKSYLRIYTNSTTSASYGHFIPGTTIEVISAPAGQSLPPVQTIPEGSNYYVVYPYSTTMNSSSYENLVAGTYVVRVTTPCGDDPVDLTIELPGVNASYTTSTSSSSSVSYSYYCKENLNKSYAYIYSYADKIPGGTRIVFTDGPNGLSDPAVLWKDVTIPPGYTQYFNPFYTDYTYTSYYNVVTPVSSVGVTPGSYTFSIIDGACGNTVTITLTVPEAYYIDEPLSIIKEYKSCDDGGNLEVFPLGNVKRSGTTYDYYWIGSAVNEYGITLPTTEYPTDIKRAGESFQIWRNGTYRIHMSRGTTTSRCFSDTLSFVYTQPMAMIDPQATSAYVCVGQDVGRLRLKGTGGYGSGPYEYEIIGSGLPTNTTGDFIYGTRAEEVTVRITDISPEAQALNCAPSLLQTVNMLDMQTAKIAYEPNGGLICVGDSIQLCCVTLGETYYRWTGPNGYTSSQQYSVIRNATIDMSGWYKVEVWPEFCGEIVYDSVFIQMNPLPDMPVLGNTFLRPCYNTGTKNYATETGIVVPSGFSAKWYNEDGTVITSSTFATSTYFDKNYFVTLVNDVTGCEGSAVPFRIQIQQPPLPPHIDIPATVCYGVDGIITISNSDPAYTYTMYTSNTTATIADSQVGNSGTLTFTVANITSATTRYFAQTDNAVGCPSARSSVVIGFSASGQPSTIEVPSITICGNDSTKLTVSSSVENPIYRWYTTNTTSAQLLHTGATYQTPKLYNYSQSNMTYTYYVTVEGTGLCENHPTAKAPVNITVKPMPLIYVYSTSNNGSTGNGVQYFIGNGTSTAIQFPLNIWYRYSYTQQIYDEAELAAAGIVPNSTISNIAFQYLNINTTRNNVSVYLGSTPKSTFTGASDWVTVNGLTKVYQGNLVLTNEEPDNWSEVPFDNSYTYPGGNLVVAMFMNHGSYDNSSPSFKTHDVTGNKTIYYYSDSSIPNVDNPPSGTTVAMRDNIRFTAYHSKVSICIGKTDTLATTIPDGSWSSSDPSIATISDQGIVSGISEGEVVITFTPYSDDYCVAVSDTVTVTALPVVSITGSDAICINGTTQLSPVTGGTWESSNPAVATVTDAGVVTGVSAGTATFTFTNESGCSSTTPYVTVYNFSTTSNIIARDTSLCGGNSIDLSLLATSTGVTSPVFRWYTSLTSTTPLPSTIVTFTGTTTYYVSVEGVALCEGQANATGRAAVNVTMKPYATPAIINVSGDSICSNSTATLVLTAPDVTNPIFKWYKTLTGDTPRYAGTPFVTPVLTADTTYYVTVSGENYCENQNRAPVTVHISCVALSGTVFPFVYTNEEELDTLFKVTAELYDVPPIGVLDPVDAIYSSTPLYTATAVYYDGTVYVPGTPKNPGNLGRINNPGKPISWGELGRTESSVDHTVVTGVGDVPVLPVGVYAFTGVEINKNYILKISRDGYVDRFAKITVTGDGYLGHRLIIPGDVNGDLEVMVHDASVVNSKTSEYGESKYDPKYDINGNGIIDTQDNSLINFYLNFYFQLYEDTNEWLIEYE